MRRTTTGLAASAALALLVGSLLAATPAAAKPLRAECTGDQQVNCEAVAR